MPTPGKFQGPGFSILIFPSIPQTGPSVKETSTPEGRSRDLESIEPGPAQPLQLAIACLTALAFFIRASEVSTREWMVGVQSCPGCGDRP